MKLFIMVLCNVLAIAHSNKNWNNQARRQIEDILDDVNVDSSNVEILDDRSRENAARECYKGLYGCWNDFQDRIMIHFRDVYLFQHIKEVGPHEICSLVIDASDCTASKVAEPKCTSPPNRHIDYMRRSVPFSEYLCQKRREDVDKHWNCILDKDIVSKIIECAPSPHVSCEDLKSRLQCFEAAINASYACQPGASDLGIDLLGRYMSIVSQCPEPESHKSVLNRSWLDIM